MFSFGSAPKLLCHTSSEQTCYSCDVRNLSLPLWTVPEECLLYQTIVVRFEVLTAVNMIINLKVWEEDDACVWQIPLSRFLLKIRFGSWFCFRHQVEAWNILRCVNWIGGNSPSDCTASNARKQQSREDHCQMCCVWISVIPHQFVLLCWWGQLTIERARHPDTP